MKEPRKYKVIKESPCGPPLEAVFNEDSTLNGTKEKQFHHQTTGTYYAFSESYLKKYSEFFEEIVPKDYEILEIDGYSGRYAIQKNGKFQFGGTLYGDFTQGCSIEKHLTDPRYPHHITKIKRLSDGEVFTIGDHLKGHKNPISEIVVNKKDDKDYRGMPWLGMNDGEGGMMIYSTKDIKPSPLFTTEDGIDIFDRNHVVWCVDIHYNKLNVMAINYVKSFQSLKCFSTEYTAGQYIFQNKPCLSFKDVQEKMREDGSLFNEYELQMLVREKLKL